MMISASDFAAAMADMHFEPQPTVAVAVSGGADSIALLRLMQDWLAPQQGRAIALTVDHGLRANSAQEARQVKAWCKSLGVAHHTLKWTGDKPTTGILAAARAARYDLLQNWCRKHHVLHLAVAQHADDQLETLLLRFSKGSGVAGLCGMQAVSYLPHVRLLRPLLSCPKAALVITCKVYKQKWLEDPSNQNQKFARPRLRDSAAVLQREGFDTNSAALLASRMTAAKDALQTATTRFLAQHARLMPGDTANWPLEPWQDLPAEIQMRALTCALQLINPANIHIRHAQLADLQQSLQQTRFRGRTLAGCKIKIRHGMLMISGE